MHWADKTVDELLKRGSKHVIETGTSISGIPHVGNASDVIRGDAIRKVLEERGIKPGFIWIADDSDPFRKVPKGMENLTKYLGYPVSGIPDLDGCHDNFADHFIEPFLNDLEEFGVKPTPYSTTELYNSGKFYEGIKIALKNSERIIGILNKFRREPLPRDFIPWNPICERCGKISTTRPYDYGAGIVRYTCEDTPISGGVVEGCGHKGESDIKKGRGKLPWRVEWAMRWSYFKVTCEPLGKEHASAGGSFWTSKVISKEIFQWDCPLPLIYEFFTLNGEKMSSSMGNVITPRDWLQIAEPEVLRFFMYKKLQKQRDISHERISNLIDDYDMAEKVYFGLENGKDKIKRTYELSQVKKPRLLQVPFTLCAVLSQIPNVDLETIKHRLENLGYRDFDLERLSVRLNLANNWVKLYGPEHLRFELLEDAGVVKSRLTQKQKNGLSILSSELKTDWKARELHKRIYEIARSIDLEPTKLFEAIYLVLIGKKCGPKAASFILTLDRDWVVKRFISL